MCCKDAVGSTCVGTPRFAIYLYPVLQSGARAVGLIIEELKHLLGSWGEVDPIPPCWQGSNLGSSGCLRRLVALVGILPGLQLGNIWSGRMKSVADGL